MKEVAKTETILGVTMTPELAAKLKDKYQNKQLDKLATSVEAREAHVAKIAKLRKEFEELTSGVSIEDNVTKLNPKLKEALVQRIMDKHEDRLLDLLEQIHREDKAIEKIDKSFELLGELM